MQIDYRINAELTAEQFIALLHNSGLAARRPVNDKECIQGMLDNANLTVTAWHDDNLVGIARSVTDFHYACYLSDLAVHHAYQQQGIGNALIQQTQSRLQLRCKLILLAAPDANDYYPKLGFVNNPRCWVIDKSK